MEILFKLFVICMLVALFNRQKILYDEIKKNHSK
jgi:hypothetical protein